MSKALLSPALLLFIGVASAQPLPPPGGGLGASSGVATLYVFGNAAGVGNGADTTEDTLVTYTIPAATLKSVGDRIRIFANGGFTSSGDSKTARVRLNGATAFQNALGTTTTGWTIYMEVQKFGAGANQDLTASYSLINNANGGVGGGSAALSDTSPITLTVTGQNSTTATANTITVRYVAVEYLP